MVQRKALGRGLEALIPDMSEGGSGKPEGLLQVALDEIHPNPLQPRRTFNQEKIEDILKRYKIKVSQYVENQHKT